MFGLSFNTRPMLGDNPKAHFVGFAVFMKIGSFHCKKWQFSL